MRFWNAQWFGSSLFPVIMMTSSNGNFFALLDLCAGNSPVTGEFPAQRPVTRSFDACFDLHLNKRLSKQSWGWWSKTLSRPLWRHCNERFIICSTHVADIWTNITSIKRRSKCCSQNLDRYVYVLIRTVVFLLSKMKKLRKYWLWSSSPSSFLTMYR